MTPTLERQQLDELKARVDLVELFRSRGLEPKKRGKSWLCCCPFHDDQDASLSINNERRLWQCFGCKAAGDGFDFLRLKEKLEFPAALAVMQELAGELPAPAISNGLPGNFKRCELLARVAEMYQKCFAQAQDAQAYLTGRGLSSIELWKAFQVGFCDGTLLKALPDSGDLVDAMQAIGVLTAEKKELFRGCVVVPLTHPDHGVVGLYGRRIRPDATNRHLYLPGPHQGVLNWQSLKASPTVFLTEGVLDAMAAWQAGCREVSCVFGTQAVPEPLLGLCQRYKTQEVVLALDGDRAGFEATQRLAEAFVDRKVSSVKLPDGKDPCLVLQEQGEASLKKLLSNRHQAPAPPPPAMERSPLDKGFELVAGELTYRVELIPPFSSRLRANVGAYHADGRWARDRVDFYLQRDRDKLARHLSSLQLSRPVAEQHVSQLLQEAENWVRDHRKPTPADTPETKPEMAPEERERALSFLRHPHLTRQLLQDMEDLGYIGEEKPKLLAYLIGLSRKLPKPLSGIILSQSGCGKSTLTEIVEQLTPPEDVMMFTRITAQALQYMAQFLLKGKLIIVEERTGAESAEYSIRILQSRQKLTQAVPQKDPTTGKIATQIITVEGPVAYLETTTDAKINHENATRCFEITLDESQEQTERIHQAQRSRRLFSRTNLHRLAEGIQKRHHNAQRLLEPLLVFIPYADKLSFPSKKLRNRRDHERFLSLIEVSAFLHQFQRERGQTEDGDDYVLANVDDYRLAYQLAHDVLSVTLHELSRGAKDLWEQVRAWVWAQADGNAKDFQFSRRDLRRITEIEDHQLRAALQELVEMEYLEVVSGGNGRATIYRLLAATEQEAPVALLTPEELERRL